MSELETINTLLAALRGQISWSPSIGHGSYFTIELGIPHLIVRDPIAHSKVDGLKKRGARIIGDCTVWVQDCYWELFNKNVITTSSNSCKNDIVLNIKLLNGQTLTDIRYKDQKIEVIFEDNIISIMPDGDPETTAISMNFLNGHIFYFRGNGCCSREIFPPRHEYLSKINLDNIV